MDRLYLHIPTYEELSYRQRILSDPATMSYNANYDINYKGYHKETGCIDFNKEDWPNWYSFWINNKPQCFYAYIVIQGTNEFIGEVNLHYNKTKDWYEMGIVIEDKYRGNGYSLEALNKLLEVAFNEFHARAVHNNFETKRSSAYKVHLDAGFEKIEDDGNIVDLLIKRNEI